MLCGVGGRMGLMVKRRRADDRDAELQKMQREMEERKKLAEEEMKVLKRLVNTPYNTLGVLRIGVEGITKGDLRSKDIWRTYLGQAAAAHAETQELLHEMIATSYELAGDIMSQRDLAHYTELSSTTIHRIIASAKEKDEGQKESS